MTFFVPTAKQKKSYITHDIIGSKVINNVFCFNLGGVLYQELTGLHKYFVALDQETADSQAAAQERLQKAVKASGRYAATGSGNTIGWEDSSHIYGLDADTTKPDFATTRIYIPGGLEASRVMSQIIEAGAQFSYAKVWLPSADTSRQPIRHDSPIVETRTFDELHSVLDVLRGIKADGQLPAAKPPLTGVEIPALPGVFVGQIAGRTSFNSNMDRLFGEPMQASCENITLQAGDVLSENLLADISFNVRSLAQVNAATSDLGISTEHHAFMANQPIGQIIQSLNRAS